MRGLILDLLRKLVARILSGRGWRKRRRVWKGLFDSSISGYYQDVKEVLNGAFYTESYEEMILVKDIDLFCLCEHPHAPLLWQMSRGLSAR